MPSFLFIPSFLCPPSSSFLLFNYLLPLTSEIWTHYSIISGHYKTLTYWHTSSSGIHSMALPLICILYTVTTVSCVTCNIHWNEWRPQPDLMRWILVWIMPQVQDQSLNLLICSPMYYHCAMTAPIKTLFHPRNVPITCVLFAMLTNYSTVPRNIQQEFHFAHHW